MGGIAPTLGRTKPMKARVGSCGDRMKCSGGSGSSAPGEGEGLGLGLGSGLGLGQWVLRTARAAARTPRGVAATVHLRSTATTVLRRAPARARCACRSGRRCRRCRRCRARARRRA
eukprot:scaffold119466_cov24-Phaeocystis_antarctica.AAC.1